MIPIMGGTKMNDIIALFGEYFSYPFIRYAFICGILIALCSSLAGVILVLKRYSLMGDGLSHVAFGALAIATVLKINNEIIIVTARNEKLSRSFQNMRKATLEWLEKNNIYYDKYYDDAYKEGKVRVCKKEGIDIIIDDDINNYLAFKDSGIKTLLFDDKGKYLDIVDRVGSWREVEEVLFND